MDIADRSWLSFAFTVSVSCCYQIACLKRRRDKIYKFKRRQKDKLSEVVKLNGSKLGLPVSLQTRETLFHVVRGAGVIHTASNSEQGNITNTPFPGAPFSSAVLVPPNSFCLQY